MGSKREAEMGNVSEGLRDLTIRLSLVSEGTGFSATVRRQGYIAAKVETMEGEEG
jgi:hypothetical protein